MRPIVIPPAMSSTFARRLADGLRGTDTGCREWTGSLTANGYGTLSISGANYLVHRVAWTLANGPIPAGLDLDHLCRNRRCANPAHLEPVTRAENLRRSDQTIAAQRRQKTHCKRGHSYADFARPRRDGGRDCRACQAAANRRYRARKRADQPSGVHT